MSFLPSWLKLKPRTTHRRRTARLLVELLEDRTLLSVQPVTLADPSLFGLSPSGTSSQPSISADGQLVVFQSDAANIAANDFNGASDVFLYNRGTGQTTLLSVSAD